MQVSERKDLQLKEARGLNGQSCRNKFAEDSALKWEVSLGKQYHYIGHELWLDSDIRMQHTHQGQVIQSEGFLQLLRS